MNAVKLHLASGKDYREGYINVDLYQSNTDRVDLIADIRKLPFDDNSVDEILALHVIEHFDFFEGQHVLNEWYRVLKPGGLLILETPDFLETCREFVNCSHARRLELYLHFFAAPWVDGQTHKFLFTEDQLKCQLGWAGFRSSKRIRPLSIYNSEINEPVLLAMEAVK